jgi:7-carboxy-7-deazaguanine synthase
LTGCPLRCKWCDTAYGFAGGRTMQHSEIISEVDRLGVRLVELTGGEPLAQESTPELMSALVARGYRVLIETSGSESLARLPPEAHVIMDIKCPDSKMEGRNRLENLQLLKPTDEIKLVLASRADYEWARGLIQAEQLDERFHVLLSCAWGLVQPKDLAAWMVEDRLDRVRLQLQQHKYIWGPRAKGV